MVLASVGSISTVGSGAAGSGVAPGGSAGAAGGAGEVSSVELASTPLSADQMSVPPDSRSGVTCTMSSFAPASSVASSPAGAAGGHPLPLSLLATPPTPPPPPTFHHHP